MKNTLSRILLILVFSLVFRAGLRAETNSVSKRVLIVTTSHSVLGRTGYPTGVWLP